MLGALHTWNLVQHILIACILLTIFYFMRSNKWRKKERFFFSYLFCLLAVFFLVSAVRVSALVFCHLFYALLLPLCSSVCLQMDFSHFPQCPVWVRRERSIWRRKSNRFNEQNLSFVRVVRAKIYANDKILFAKNLFMLPLVLLWTDKMNFLINLYQTKPNITNISHPFSHHSEFSLKSLAKNISQWWTDTLTTERWLS